MSKRPTKDELDQRVKVFLPADEFVKAVLETGEHPDEKPKDAKKPPAE